MANNGLPPTPEWNGLEYVRVPDGIYQAVAVRYQGPEWVYTYRRWSSLLEFELLDNGARVCAFYNFGERREKPTVFRRGRFYTDWTKANRDRPRKHQPMTSDVFFDNQIYTVEVKESRKTESDGEKEDSEIYSRVTKILRVEFP
jgi:hypothetical protein